MQATAVGRARIQKAKERIDVERTGVAEKSIPPEEGGPASVPG